MAKKILSVIFVLLMISVVQYIFILFFINEDNRYEDSDFLIYHEPVLMSLNAIPIIGFVYNKLNKYGYIVVEFKDGSRLAKKTVGFSYRLKLESADIKHIDWHTMNVEVSNKSINIYDKDNDILRVFVPEVFITCP